MKKIIFTIAFIASGLVATAQVGVGTENPQTSLHIVGANATSIGPSGTNEPGALAATDGITVPVVTTEMTAPGTPVDGTRVGQMVYSNFAGKTGFYYWDGTIWVAVGAQPYQNIVGSVQDAVAGDTVLNTAYLVKYTGIAGALNTPTAVEGKTFHVRNNGTGAITIASVIVGVGKGRTFISDGTSWIMMTP